ncbi:MAG: MBOAT family protein, partial [Bacteroidetes bacterium]
MAVGLGRMMGFVFPENFNSPYISSSITEFWRRWHMTLSRWMKDYLYIPLGGNRGGTARMYANLWTVFLISGLWHGASWNFVLWGAYHGLFLVLERLFLNSVYEKAGRIPSIFFTFFVVILGWVIFRAENMSDAAHYYKALFSFGGEFHMPRLSTEFWSVLTIALLFAFAPVLPRLTELSDHWLLSTKVPLGVTITRTLVGALLFVFCLSMITASGFNPFIYFKF